MKVIKGVVKVIGIVATVLSFIPGPHQPIAATVAKVAMVVSAGLEIAAPTKAKASARGSPAEYRLDPNTGIPMIVGRTQYAGTGIKRETWGSDNKWQCFTSVYSLGPIQSIDQFTIDRAVINFDGSGNAVGQLNDRMYFRSQLGLCPSPLMACPGPGGAAYPGWTATRKLSGLAASHWVLKFDKDGKFFTGGPPTPGVVAKGVKVYDPRLDSTYPGGSGACRALQEDTYVYSETPHLHALTFALGRYQNGKRRFGIGFPKDAIDIPYFVNAANIDEANNWKVSGVVFSTDGKWNVLKMLMEAGGGQPITLGGKLSGLQSAPRVSIATIGSSEVVGRCSVQGTQSRRERINGVVPRYRSEAHGWEYVPATTVRVTGYQTQDGAPRTRELEWTLVNQVKQASQLSYYFMANAREFGPIELTLKIRWIGLKPGDCVTLNIPELNLNNQRAIVLTRNWDIVSGAVTLTFRSETNEKHAAALALDGEGPPIPGMAYDADAVPPSPGIGAWALSVGALSSGSGTVPSLRFTGAADHEAVDAIEFSYRKVGAADWNVIMLAPSNTIRVDEAAVEPGAQYEGRVRYMGGNKFTGYLTLGPITVEAAAAGSAVIANSIVGQGALATLSAVNPGHLPVMEGGNLLMDNIFAQYNVGALPSWYGVLNGGLMPTKVGPTHPACTAMSAPSAVQFTSGGAPTPGGAPRVDYNTLLPVVAGETYRMRMRYRVEAGFNGQLAIVAFCYGPTGAFIGQIGPVGKDWRTTPAPSDAVGSVVSAPLTIPAGTANILPSIIGFWHATNAPVANGYVALPEVRKSPRLGEPRALPPVTALNVGYRFTGAISYTSTPTAATINVAAGSILFGSEPINYNAMSVGVSGSGGTTVTFHLYITEDIDTTTWGGSKTLLATSNPDVVTNNDNNVWLGSVQVAFPSVGSTGGTGFGGGGSGVRDPTYGGAIP